MAKETEISAALWALWLGKDFTFCVFIRSTSWLYLLHSATNSLWLSIDIVRNITLSERRVCSHKTSLRWSTSNDIQPYLTLVIDFPSTFGVIITQLNSKKPTKVDQPTLGVLHIKSPYLRLALYAQQSSGQTGIKMTNKFHQDITKTSLESK